MYNNIKIQKKGKVRMTIKNAEIVVAVSENNIIGKDNKLIWNIKEDLKLFKEITNGHYIVMGRKTYESLPGILPNRKHIILTRNKDYKIDDDRVIVFYNELDLIDYIKKKNNEKFFIIGGGEIYRMFYSLVDKMNVSRVHQVVEGDTTFPIIDNSWEIESYKEYKEFTYYKYKKKS